MANIQKTYSQVLGAVLAIVGVAGFFVGTGSLLLFGVNTLHSIIHLLSGILLIVFAGKKVNMWFGSIYGVVTILGFALPSLALSLLNINMADNFLHLAISLATLGVAFGVKEE